MSPLADVAALALSLSLCHAVAFLGGRWTRRNLGWYGTLDKPAWTPPGLLIGLVWTVLYTLMGIAAWLVWREAGGLGPAALPLSLFAAQLLLNAAWSGLFFGRRRPGVAFADLVLLWLAIAATAWAFAPVSPLAALLLLPYLAWVGFAGALNLAVWRRNPGRHAERAIPR